jgi:hypothetical protein
MNKRIKKINNSCSRLTKGSRGTIAAKNEQDHEEQ